MYFSHINKVLIFTGLLFSAAQLNAQSLPVGNGTQAAEDCFRHAAIVVRLNRATSTPDMIKSCSAALEMNPLSDQDRAAIYNNRGILLAGRGELSKALADYDQALRIVPDLGEVYVNRGFLFYFESQFEEAIADFNRAMGLERDRAYLAYLGRGMSSEELGRFADAEADYLTVLEYMPDWPRAHNRMDRLRERMADSR